MAKIDAILKLTDKQELERAGSSLDLSETHQIFHLLAEQKIQAEQFLPLMVGINQGIFTQFLETLSSEEELILKELGSMEPLLHKLAILSHDLKQDLEALVKNVYEITAKIAAINLEQITKQDIFTRRRVIDELDSNIENHIKILNNALAIAWNSKRVDLIDSLSTLKDLFLRTSTILIGQPKQADAAASGLYKKLEDRLNQVYSYDTESSPFNDNDPAIEALTSFGIFYLEDYVELGLLPDVRSIKDLKHALKTKSFQELNSYLESILAQVEKTLKNLGLINVKSFKDAKIYSRDILKEYIQNKIEIY